MGPTAPEPAVAARESAGAAAEALASALAPLWICRYVVHVKPKAPLALPLFGRGTILRGGFGLAFRRQVCPDLTLACRACPLLAACPYPRVFETAPPPDADRLRNFSDIPRPFAVDPPDDPRTLFRPTDELRFGLIVVGHANRYLPLFVDAFRDLARSGLGPRRAPFELKAVEACAPDGTRRALCLAGDAAPTLDPETVPRSRAADLLRPGDATRTHVTLRFETPLDLRDRGRSVERPAFGPLLRRLRDRAAALAAFFGDAPLDLDFRALGDAADSVRLVADGTRRVQVRRASQRTGAEHDVGGLMGDARYEGEGIGAFMPLVRLGEVIHAGRHAAFGNGRLRVLA